MKYMGRYTFTLSILLFFSFARGQMLDSTTISDNLKNYLIDNKSDLKEYYKLVFNNINVLSTDKVIEYSKKGYFVADSTYSADSLSVSFLEVLMFGYSQSSGNKSDSLLFYGDLMVQKANQSKLYNLEGSCENLIGTHYLNNRDYSLAIKHYLLAVKAFHKTDMPYSLGQPYGNMATVYMEIGDIPNAIKYTKVALEYAKSAPENILNYKVGFQYFQLFSFYKELNLKDSLEYYRKLSITTLSKIDEPFSVNEQNLIYWSYLTSAEYFIDQDNQDSILHYLNLAAPLKDIYPFFYDKVELDYCLEKGTCTNAKQKFEHLRKEAINSGLNEDEEFLVLQKKYYEQEGLYFEAMETEEKRLEFQRKTFTKERNNYAAFMNSQFEAEEKKKQIDFLEKNSELQDLRSLLLTFGLIFIFFLFVLSIIVLIQIRQKNQLLKNDLVNQKVIENQAREIKQNYENKNKFFGNISHELRTPLTLILGNIEQILASPLQSSEERKSNLQSIKNSSEELLQLTNQILDLAKSEFQDIKLKQYSFKLKDFFDYLYDEYYNLADRKKIQLLFPNNVDPSIELSLDINKLVTILKNLLANAIKYNTTEYSKVSLSYTLTDDDIQIYISDSGKGISKEQIPFIFDRFYQAPNNETISSGFGIGLAICKEYVQLMGGSISVDSILNEGSTFMVKIPIRKPKTIIPTFSFPTKNKSTASSFPNITEHFQTKKDYLLIVEDNVELCQYLDSILQKDYNLSFAHNGKEALEQITINPPKIILTDWMMPVMDGMSLIKQLKENSDFANIPILMLTAREDIKEQISLLQVGVDDYLTKPFNQNELKAHLANLLELSTTKKNNAQVEIYAEKNTVDKELIEHLPSLTSKDKLFLEDLNNFVLSNLGEFNFTTEALADLLELSPRHLARKVKQLSGLTINQYVLEIRFSEAKRMLIEREYSTVKAVTYSVGFKSEKYFSRNFKKRFGKYPKEFLY